MSTTENRGRSENEKPATTARTAVWGSADNPNRGAMGTRGADSRPGPQTPRREAGSTGR